MNPHLSELLVSLDHQVVECRELCDPLSDDQLKWKPDPRSWSILECFDHLRVTGSLYYPRLEEAIERAREHGREETKPYRPGWFARKMIRFVGVESKTKLKAPRVFRPSSVEPDRSILDQFFEQEVELLGLIRRADGVELNRVKFASPVTRLIRFSIGEGFALMVAHQERHLRQAQRIAKSDRFPTA